MPDEPEPPTDDEVAASLEEAIRKLTGDAPAAEPPGNAPETRMAVPPPTTDEV